MDDHTLAAIFVHYAPMEGIFQVDFAKELRVGRHRPGEIFPGRVVDGPFGIRVCDASVDSSQVVQETNQIKIYALKLSPRLSFREAWRDESS